MKALTFSLLAAASTLSGCQVPNAQRAEAAELPPTPASLADRLPADTIGYFALPDIPAMRSAMEQSTLVRIYRDPEMQAFLGQGLEMVVQAWEKIREESAAQGVPIELTHWEALRSFEMGFALRPAPGMANPFEQPPHVNALARLGLAPGLGFKACDALLGLIDEEFQELENTPARRVLSLMNGVEEGQPIRALLTATDDALELSFDWGAAGAGRLSETDAYRRAWHRNAVPGTAVFGFLHLSDAIGAIQSGLNANHPEVGAILGEFFERALGAMDSVSFASGWDERGSFTYASLDLEEAAAGDPLWVTLPADHGLAAYVPANASAFAISSGASGPWVDLVMRTIDRVGGFHIEDAGVTVGEMLQGQAPDLHAWLFGEHRAELDRAIASFGTRSFSYSAPTGGLSAEAFSFVELSDPAGMAAALEQLMPRLREALKGGDSPVQLSMKRTKRSVTQPDGTTVEEAGPAYYYIEFEFPPELQQVLGMIGQTFQPCFAVAPEGWLVFSMNVGSVRKILKDGMIKPDATILENESARAFLAAAPRNAHAVAWSDPRPATAAAMGMIGGLLPMLSGLLGDNAARIPLNLQAFPSPEAFVRHMRTMEMVSFEAGGDMRTMATGSFGLADLFTSLGAIASLVPPFVAVAGELFENQDPPADIAAPPPPPGEVEF